MTKRQLELAVTRARTGKVRARYPDELKAALIEFGREQRAAGATWREVGHELGLSERMVSVLCRGRRARSGHLRPVSIVPDALAAGAGLTITLPGGAIVEGLDVAMLAAVLKALS